ncbi:hypothetical protein LL240_09170 [Oceanimonas baumannii]|nr:hypothetical protein [Oceanimonas baumannii]MCC4264628.1 hypothetical protein [Oceanimonas baumannii]
MNAVNPNIHTVCVIPAPEPESILQTTVQPALDSGLRRSDGTLGVGLR